MTREIQFDRVKRVVLANIDRLPCCCTIPSRTTFVLGAVKTYLGDGVAMTSKAMLDAFKAQVRRFIENADVRCVKEILELCPAGVDNRLPRWLYDSTLDAYMDDECNWILAPLAIHAQSH